MRILERLRFTFTPNGTANVNLYPLTKYSPYFSCTVYCFYTKISSFMPWPVLSIKIVLDCFYLLIFYSKKFSTDVCRLPFAVYRKRESQSLYCLRHSEMSWFVEHCSTPTNQYTFFCWVLKNIRFFYLIHNSKFSFHSIMVSLTKFSLVLSQSSVK